MPQGTQTTRKPILLLRSPGFLLLRYAERQLRGLLFQEPPRLDCLSHLKDISTQFVREKAQ